MADIIERNADYIRSKITEIPKTAIVLGSGLGDMGPSLLARDTIMLLNEL